MNADADAWIATEVAYFDSPGIHNTYGLLRKAMAWAYADAADIALGEKDVVEAKNAILERAK